uniref:ADAM metallopeptidase domain 9 n=1 Tax=Apteryx owenii TaxID=8824 RepID=A0A8B9NZ79_APTOW
SPDITSVTWMALSVRGRLGCCLVGMGFLRSAKVRVCFQQISLLSSYEVIIPQRLGRERREASSVSSVQVSYAIEIEGKEYTIHLEKNKELLPKDFTVYTYNKEGKLQSEKPGVQVGFLSFYAFTEGDLNIEISHTLPRFRGLVTIENITYGIEPMDSSSGSKHIMYRLDNVKKEPVMCGVTTEGHEREHAEENHYPSMTQLLRRKRAVLHQTRYVELFIVVDKEKFEDFGKSEAEVREHMVQLANFLDSMYIMLNIRIVLVGLEIWKHENIISTDGGAGDVLANFVQWREKNLVTRRRHDSAQFVLKKGFGGTAGMAYVGTVCSKSHAGGINVFGRISIQMFASIVAHELGHNLGMNHDDERVCHCGASSCIMSSGASGSRNFSSCSAEDFEKLTLNKGGSCLLNVPKPDETYSVPYCGNRLVDAGEECDCGSPKECESDPCCEPGTCRLQSGAECAYGDCCRNCRFLPGGTECRASNNECDLPEYCNGTSQFCQPDFTVQNGHPCHNEEAYCYNGVCQYYDAQCQDIFGSKAKAAPNICFTEVNSKGDRFGNCGFHGHDYKKCSSWNAMCGKLQCENVKTMPVFGIKPAIIQTPIRDTTTCWGVDFQLGSDVPDPGMVNEGTKCDTGKICRHFQCVSASVLNYDCDVERKCHGHGVCNNNRNCHCEAGWAPPYCDTKGYGGSLDSGPPYNDKDTSLRNGLLVFFFLILPLLVATALAFAKRDKLKRWFRRLMSRCHSPPPPQQKCVPQGPPPPQQKCLPQGQYFPSRPAPLPPK